MTRLRMALAAALAALTGLAAVPASGAGLSDPGRWQLVKERNIPLTYYQGSTGDGADNLFFSGHVTLTRTDLSLRREARKLDVIPPRVHVREGYNHIGDIDYDTREGGRVLLPLECYYERASQQVCKTGSIGVVDPETLAWRYYVKLDPAEIPKAMWCEVGPDGLLWTSVGRDLIAYRLSDITRANAAPDAAPIRSVRRLVGAVPAAGITGAVFHQGRLFTAGQDGRTFTVTSIDLATGAHRLEIVREIVGEGEGLAVTPGFGGRLHWQVMPYNTETIPTYGIHHGELLTFEPTKA